MGWAIGYDERTKRDIGYGVPAICDHPGCDANIDRGLGYVCGGEPYGGEYGCGLFFCTKHHNHYLATEDDEEEIAHSLCDRCAVGNGPYEPKPDVQEWVDWKMTDESWAVWRAENPDFVKQHTKAGA